MVPYGYHVTNVVLHAIVSVLTWRMLARLRIPGAWVAAAIFAVHPVCVESVAWISERKNTISQIFFLLSIMSYLKFEAEARTRTYVLSVAYFTLALLAKTSVVMLPFVLLLLAWWKRGTLTSEDAFTYWKRALLRTIPFFLAAFVLGLVTIYFQYGRAIGSEVIPIGTIPQRMASACFAAGFYLYSALFPYNLMVIYPQWHLAGTAGDRHFIPYYLQVLPGIAIAALLVWCWMRRRRLWARSHPAELGLFPHHAAAGARAAEDVLYAPHPGGGSLSIPIHHRRHRPGRGLGVHLVLEDAAHQHGRGVSTGLFSAELRADGDLPQRRGALDRHPGEEPGYLAGT